VPQPPMRPRPDPRAIRPAHLHAADRIACPACDTPLRRLASGEGSLVASCDGRRRVRPTDAHSVPCDQALYAGVGPDGVAVVLPITRDELEVLSAGTVVPPLRQALELLGVLRARTPSAVPRHRCGICDTETALTDLYAGICRTCAGVCPVQPARAAS
jgi:hypothetical protein